MSWGCQKFPSEIGIYYLLVMCASGVSWSFLFYIPLSLVVTPTECACCCSIQIGFVKLNFIQITHIANLAQRALQICKAWSPPSLDLWFKLRKTDIFSSCYPWWISVWAAEHLHKTAQHSLSNWHNSPEILPETLFLLFKSTQNKKLGGVQNIDNDWYKQHGICGDTGPQIEVPSGFSARSWQMD